MTIGIDISVLQSAHRMRGIGYTLINFINHLSAEDKQNHSFVFFAAEGISNETMDLLDLEGVDYAIHKITQLTKATSLIQKISGIIRYPSSRVDLTNIDCFIQFDQSSPLPKHTNTKLILIAYDLIPYVLESEYLYRYKTARTKGHSRKGSIRKHLQRVLYLRNIKKNIARADKVIAISEHTLQDFMKYTSLSLDKAEVCYLGVRSIKKTAPSSIETIKRYLPTSWGYIPQQVPLPSKPFLLFVGGADPRRRLPDLIAAFNNLRGQGYDVSLVLAGDTMQGPSSIPIPETRSYLESSSYGDDIYFMGFTDDNTRDWLYKNALAFVYPSIYEGFGLPIIEAMQLGTPVITYKNSSIAEVGGDAALYANNFLDIAHITRDLLKKNVQKNIKENGKKNAERFSWERTSAQIIRSIQ